MTSTNNSPARLMQFEYLRIFACFAVILIHTSAGIFTASPKMTYDWWMGNLFDSASRMAVPIFVMISGYFLLNKDYGTDVWGFYKKRLGKILFPVLFWSFIYLLNYGWKALHGAIAFSPKIFLGNLAFGTPGGAVHLWYMYMLIGLYLATPFLSVLVHRFSSKILWGVVIYWFVGLSLNLFSQVYTDSMSKDVFVLRFLDFIPYFLLGHLLGNYILKIESSRKYCGMFFCLYVLASLVIAGVATVNSDYSYKYESLFVALQAVTFFSFVLLLSPPKNLLERITKGVSSHTFGIYLVHILVLAYLRKMLSGIFPQMDAGLTIVVLATGCFVISLFLVMFLKKIPYLKSTV